MHTGGFIHGGQRRGGGPQLKACFMLIVLKDHTLVLF